MGPAPILSEHQFYAQYGNRFGRQGSGAYTRYRSYVEKRRVPTGQLTPAATPPHSPAATIAPPHPAAAATPDLMAQATALVNKALAPLIGSTNQSYDREQALESLAIQQATDQYQKAVAGFAPAAAGAYHQAEGTQAGGDAALANLLSGAGTQGANDLAARLGGVGGAEVPASAQAIGQGSAAAGYGMGSADLSKLVSQGASEAAYGAKLPGLAALTGLQDTKSALTDLAAKRADALSQITSAGPGQAVNLYQQLVSNRQTARENAANRAQTDRLAGLTTLGKVTTAADKASRPDPSLSRTYGYVVDSNGNAIVGPDGKHVPVAKTPKTPKPDTSTRPDPSLSKVYGYVVDATGKPILQNGQKVPVAKTGKTAAGKAAYTPQQRETAFYGTRDKVFAQAKKLYTGKKSGTGSVLNGGGGGSSRPPRAAAYKTLWNEYAPRLLSEYGYKRSAVAQMVNRALDNAGY